MKILVLALFVYAVNGAGIGSFFGSGLSNLAADIVNIGAGGGRGRIRNPIQAAAQVAVIPVAAAKAAATAAAVVASPAARVTTGAAAKAPATAVVSVSDIGPPSAANVAPAVTKSASTDSESEIIHYEADVRYDGYYYSYETSNGISAESTGELKKVNDTDVIVMKGSYKYTDKDGAPVMLTYIADENGFQPESSILPVGPPIPEEIARAVAYILSQIESGKKTNEDNK